MEWIGIGRETAASGGTETPSAPPRFFPFLANDEESYLMHCIGCDLDGLSLYVCGPTIGCHGRPPPLHR